MRRSVVEITAPFPRWPYLRFTDEVFGSDRHCPDESWTKSVCFEGRKVKIPERTV
jgi:hypothetical protein